jgi:hypothetical protein
MRGSDRDDVAQKPETLESLGSASVSQQPEFGGECAFALSANKRNVAGSSKHQIVDNEKTYYFKNGAARILWKVLPNRAAKANAVWASQPPA